MEKQEERKQEKALEKKAYEKPRIVHQQSLEVVAGACPGPTAKAVLGVPPCTTVAQS
jgi:hypothetical protein